VVVDHRAHLDLLDLDDLLMLAGLGGLFLLFVFVLPVVHQLDHGRLGLGRDLDQVETLFLADGERIVDADLAVFVAVVPDEQDSLGGDVFVDPWPVL
jgi:hypothetical protein